MARAASTRYEPLPRSSSDLSDDANLSNEYKKKRFTSRTILTLKHLRKIRRVCKPTYILISLVLFLCWQLLFNASYINAPAFAIPTDEKVFIAANNVNKELIDGIWGERLLQLVEEIGKDKVYVSVYGGPKDALERLDAKLEGVQKKILAEEDDPVKMESLHRITLPSGAQRIKRIEYLADVRNKALDPITSGAVKEKYDRVLFLNDVIFEIEGAMRLLWGTNINEEGKAEYKAVCSADFITSWKYYDTYATRDTEGYSIGIPIFPWFANKGLATSRNDVLEGRDAVRVKSCWGGMVAFDARFFQAPKTAAATPTKPDSPTTTPNLPIKFRSEPESFWDSSECCLVQADITSTPNFPDLTTDTSEEWGEGIFMNPYVRVAYEEKVFGGIRFVQRFERLFALPQRIISHFAHLPRFNNRRLEVAGELVRDRLWVPNGLSREEEEELAKEEGRLAGGLGAVERVEINGAISEMGDEEGTWQGWNSGGRRGGVKDGGVVGSMKRGSESEGKWNSRIMKASSIEKRGVQTGGEGGKAKTKEYWRKEGHFVDYERVARRGGYCGVRQLTILREGFGNGLEKGWENLRGEVPPREESS